MPAHAVYWFYIKRKGESGKVKAHTRITENWELFIESIIDKKSKVFALRIIKLYKQLKEVDKEFVLSKQILRSGTSIGANARERKNSQSKADFINKLSIALKEADETQYWLELLYESEIINENIFCSLNNDLKEIIAIITSSIKTAKQNKQ